ncbi:hypothetical protein H1C71_012539 [Ictidomys tridecemlineatus]|nr:hypothetical protein H1C71_012539 [Ictidomys tridecemlineatus]KAG3291224.1 hypothetical protein H1C71_012539 [Ictidomys tridecemlineatus]KAG3291225.1 hypothetical protein H1C71_012539 [Ictidomys tridecemlineatus]KAG3291226.1 hypothetical protein H1C71_012539 [Ictidomys tridecemlineatus]
MLAIPAAFCKDCLAASCCSLSRGKGRAGSLEYFQGRAREDLLGPGDAQASKLEPKACPLGSLVLQYEVCGHRFVLESSTWYGHSGTIGMVTHVHHDFQNFGIRELEDSLTRRTGCEASSPWLSHGYSIICSKVGLCVGFTVRISLMRLCVPSETCGGMSYIPCVISFFSCLLLVATNGHLPVSIK